MGAASTRKSTSTTIAPASKNTSGSRATANTSGSAIAAATRKSTNATATRVMRVDRRPGRRRTATGVTSIETTASRDRKCVVEGKSVDVGRASGGRRSSEKNKKDSQN